MSLSNQKVSLKIIEKHDLAHIKIWKNDLTIMNQIISKPFFSSELKISDWLNSVSNDPNQALFGIFGQSNEIIGIVRLMYIDWINRTTLLGIYIGNEKNRGQGYGKATLELIADYAFTNLNLRKIGLNVLAENHSAVLLYKKFGFQEEGCLKENVYIDGKYKDVLVMSLFKRKNYE